MKKEKYVVRKGVPLPKPTTSRKYPFGEMKVGDSVVLYKKYTREKHIYFAIAARQYARKVHPDWKFASRRIDNTIVIWRIK